MESVMSNRSIIRDLCIIVVVNYVEKTRNRRQAAAKSSAKTSRFIAVLPRSGFMADPVDFLRSSQVLTWRAR